MLAAHADWSVAPGKRWMAVAAPGQAGWRVRVEPVGEVGTLLRRLRAEAFGAPAVLGIDVPIGLPRDYAAAHLTKFADFPAFLDALAARPSFFEVCTALEQVGTWRPFYPRRPQRGMTRRSHALALGLADAAGLHRACDRATATRRAGAPLFWTLGANQAGKAAISAWRDLLLPARSGADRALLWPFEGALGTLLRPGVVAVAETYPAEAWGQLDLQWRGSKRRPADRRACAPALRATLARLGAEPDPALCAWLESGFGADAAGEDRFDCLLGLLCLLQVVLAGRGDGVPDDKWVQRWEGWILGQPSSATVRSLSSKAFPVHY